LRFGLVGASRDAGLKEGFSVTETPTACEITVRVRYAEADPMGYLHHATYFEYFEMGRTELLRQAGSRYRDLEAAGFLFVVFAVQAKYHRPARYDDELIVRTILERVTRARIDHRYEVHRDGLLLCEASTTLACVGRDGRPTGIPEELFHQLRDA
jgi:acyl-CoA thioester hydrolase